MASVSTSPGWTTVTRTPVPTASARIACASPVIAHFVAEYRLPGRTPRPDADPVSTRCPPERINAGMAARAVNAGPQTFVTTMSVHSAGFAPASETNDVSTETPAFAKTTSIRPHRDATRDMRSCTDSHDETSHFASHPRSPTDSSADRDALTTR